MPYSPTKKRIVLPPPLPTRDASDLVDNPFERIGTEEELRARPVRPAQPLPPARRLRSLDALRGVAALSVLLYHAINYGADGRMSGQMPLHSTFFRALYHVLDLGYLGVPLFFVLSGFCIHFRYASRFAKSGDTHIGFIDFMRRRVARLYPAYFVALVCSMVLLFAAYLAGKGAYTLEVYGAHPLRMLAIDFSLHASMLHGLFPTFWKTGGNAVYWTLAVECYFYLLYVPLIALRRRIGAFETLACVCGMGLLVGISAELFISRDNAWNEWFRGSVFTLWCQWVMGVLIAEAYFGIIKLPKIVSSIAFTAATFAVALYAEFHAPVLSPILFGVAFASLLSWCLKLDTTGRWPTHRLMNWLVGVGAFSYSLYLVNLPIRSTMRYLAPGLTRTTDLVHYLVVASAIVVAGYWIAKLFFKLVEGRCLKEQGDATTARRASSQTSHRSALVRT